MSFSEGVGLITDGDGELPSEAVVKIILANLEIFQWLVSKESMDDDEWMKRLNSRYNLSDTAISGVKRFVRIMKSETTDPWDVSKECIQAKMNITRKKVHLASDLSSQNCLPDLATLGLVAKEDPMTNNEHILKTTDVKNAKMYLEAAGDGVIVMSSTTQVNDCTQPCSNDHPAQLGQAWADGNRGPSAERFKEEAVRYNDEQGSNDLHYVLEPSTIIDNDQPIEKIIKCSEELDGPSSLNQFLQWTGRESPDIKPNTLKEMARLLNEVCGNGLIDLRSLPDAKNAPTLYFIIHMWLTHRRPLRLSGEDTNDATSLTYSAQGDLPGRSQKESIKNDARLRQAKDKTKTMDVLDDKFPVHVETMDNCLPLFIEEVQERRESKVCAIRTIREHSWTKDEPEYMIYFKQMKFKVDNADFIYIPFLVVGSGNEHWVYIQFIRSRSEFIFHDSKPLQKSKSRGKFCDKILRTLMLQQDPDATTKIILNLPEQQDDCSCGVWTLMRIRCTLNNIRLEFMDQGHVLTGRLIIYFSLNRITMKDIIQMKSILSEVSGFTSSRGLLIVQPTLDNTREEQQVRSPSDLRGHMPPESLPIARNTRMQPTSSVAELNVRLCNSFTLRDTRVNQRSRSVSKTQEFCEPSLQWKNLHVRNRSQFVAGYSKTHDSSPRQRAK